MDLNTVWFVLFGVLIIGYAILDGFDLGVGVIHLFTKNEGDRRVNLNAIGPVWDGNEVWLLTAGGALFAAFPVVYATVFSSFYLALMLLLFALIFRAVSIEFRGKVDTVAWKRFWDWGFGLGSSVPALLFGVAVGNILRGIPIDGDGVFQGSFLGLLNPYSLLVGLVTLSLFTMHGGLYLCMKTEGEHRDRAVSVANAMWIVFVVLYFVSTVATFFVAPSLFEGLLGNPLFWVLFLILLAAILYIPIAAKAQKYFCAFLSSSSAILAMIGLAALSMFPKLVPSSIEPIFSLTIYNASSSQRTLTVMLVIALIGMPLVIAYTAYIYRIFKGKVVITPESY
jgi:cytochrome d ubiquinol oxidase subunit II